jgi:hypothetical protein
MKKENFLVSLNCSFLKKGFKIFLENVTTRRLLKKNEREKA